MTGIEVIVGLTILLVALGAVEALRHHRNLARIPIRIHVNGTRGKSSVVRLIGAGLRAGGKVTCAKTTGTLARMIMPDGREAPVFRPSRANVIEQVRIVGAAAALKAEVLVIECMALQPSYQWLSERRFVRATHGVITNARPDHLDVMGPTPRDVALALAAMVPPKGKLFTAERDLLDVFEMACSDRAAALNAVSDADLASVTEEELAGFSYTEHRDNIALALKVCQDVGVPREIALKGMWGATPDPGAMTEHTITFYGRRIIFVNGFAANDPQSTGQIWQMALKRHPEVDTRIAVFNTRADRADRSRQLGEAFVEWDKPDHVVVMGTGTYVFSRSAIEMGWPVSLVTTVEDQSVAQIFETLVGLCGESTLIMGMGNIGGQGLDMVRYFRNREAPKARSKD